MAIGRIGSIHFFLTGPAAKLDDRLFIQKE